VTDASGDWASWKPENAGGPPRLGYTWVSGALGVGVRVLITGHEGYLGIVVREVVAGDGHEVTGLDSGLFQECTLGPEPHPIPTLSEDLRDVQVEQLEGFDAVIHLAALSNDPLGNLAPDITYAINHRASTRLARLARDAGVKRFLYSSTCSVYGASGSDDLVDEEAPLRPVTPYAVSKVLVEEDLHDLADVDFSPVSLRNATAYGFSPRLRADIVLNNLVGWAYLTGEVKVLSDGTPWRPLIHARDIATVFSCMLTADRGAVHDQAFNVGSCDQNYRVREIAETVQQTVPNCQLVITGETGNDARSYRVDFSRLLSAIPRFRTAWDIRRGAAELLDAYQRYGLTLETFQDRYTRLRWLADLGTRHVIGKDLRYLSR
jgi:nucleoside-diphosphate-sugar epimerase